MYEFKSQVIGPMIWTISCHLDMRLGKYYPLKMQQSK